jgi:hypothetical protein
MLLGKYRITAWFVSPVLRNCVDWLNADEVAFGVDVGFSMQS